MLERSQSAAVLKVLRELLPDRERYAEDIARATGIQRGVVHHILVRLETQGVAASVTGVAPLPRRRWFSLTDAGRVRAQEVLAAAFAPPSAPSASDPSPREQAS